MKKFSNSESPPERRTLCSENVVFLAAFIEVHVHEMMSQGSQALSLSANGIPTTSRRIISSSSNSATGADTADDSGIVTSHKLTSCGKAEPKFTSRLGTASGNVSNGPGRSRSQRVTCSNTTIDVWLSMAAAVVLTLNALAAMHRSISDPSRHSQSDAHSEITSISRRRSTLPTSNSRFHETEVPFTTISSTSRNFLSNSSGIPTARESNRDGDSSSRRSLGVSGPEVQHGQQIAQQDSSGIKSSSNSGATTGSLSGSSNRIGGSLAGSRATGSYPATHLRSLLSNSFFSAQPFVPLNYPRYNHRPRNSHIGGQGICIAITSSPRVHPESLETSWKHVRRLLLALDGKRARSPFLSKQMWAIVHSSGCDTTGLEETLTREMLGEEATSMHTSSASTSSTSSSRLGAATVPYTEANKTAARLAIAQQLAAVTGTRHNLTSVQSLLSALLGPKEEKQGRTVGERSAAERLIAEHTAVIEDTVRRTSIPTQVLTAHRDGCRLLQDPRTLLQWVQPEHLEFGWRRWLWQTKLALDFVFVSYQCLATKPRYVLLLQDDAFPADLWDVGIEKFIAKDLRGRPPWTLLSFTTPSQGLTGKLITMEMSTRSLAAHRRCCSTYLNYRSC